MLPPTVFPDPTLIIILPPFPQPDAPDWTYTLPLVPHVALPVLITIVPLTPHTPPSDVTIYILPLFVLEPVPLVIVTEPPLPDFDNPADKLILPPAPLLPDPTDIVIAPPVPQLDDDPDPIYTLPPEPQLATPVLNAKLPVTPPPPFAV